MTGQYTEVERSQHLTQSDRSIFGRSYVAQTSSVDGQSAFLGRTPDHSVNEFFQGLEPLREAGLPLFLPRAMRDTLKKDPAVVALKESEAAARDPHGAAAAKRDRENLLKRLERKALESFREEWIRKRRDWKILTRGKVSLEVDTDVSRLCLLIPERARITEKMKRELVSSDKTREATHDLLALCKRDYTVFYLPGEEPVDGLCPVCDKTMQR